MPLRRPKPVSVEEQAEQQAKQEAAQEEQSLQTEASAGNTKPMSAARDNAASDSVEAPSAPEVDPGDDEPDDTIDFGFDASRVAEVLRSDSGAKTDIPEDDHEEPEIAPRVPDTSTDEGPDVPPVPDPVFTSNTKPSDSGPPPRKDPVTLRMNGPAPETPPEAVADVEPDEDDEFEAHWNDYMTARYGGSAGIKPGVLQKLARFLNPFTSRKETYATPTDDSKSPRKSFPMMTLGRMVGQSALAATMVVAVMPGVSFSDIGDGISERFQEAAEYSIQLGDDALDSMTGLQNRMQDNFDDLRNDIASGIATTEVACNANQIALDVEEGVDRDGNPAAVAGLSPAPRPDDENRMTAIPSR